MIEVPVTEETVRRIHDAIDALSADPTARRTKRAVERISGVSHDAVARAFRQDAEHGSFGIVKRFNELTEGKLDRRSDHQRALGARDSEIKELRNEVKQLQAILDRYAQTILALRLELEGRSPATGSGTVSTLPPIGKQVISNSSSVGGTT